MHSMAPYWWVYLQLLSVWENFQSIDQYSFIKGMPGLRTQRLIALIVKKSWIVFLSVSQMFEKKKTMGGCPEQDRPSIRASLGCPFNSPNSISPNSNSRVRVRVRVKVRVRVRVRRFGIWRIEIRRNEKEPSVESYRTQSFMQRTFHIRSVLQ